MEIVIKLQVSDVLGFNSDATIKKEIVELIKSVPYYAMIGNYSVTVIR